MPVHKKAYWAYVGALLGGAVFLFTTQEGGFGDPLEIVTFAVIGLLAELWIVPMPGIGRISITFVVHYTSILVLGPRGAFLQTLISQPICTFIMQRRPLPSGVFKIAMLLLLSMLPNPAVHSLSWLPERLWMGYTGVLLGGAVYSIENIFLTSATMAMVTGAPLRRLWSTYSTLWLVPYFFLTLPFPVIYLWFYLKLGYLGLLIGYLPASVALAIFSHQARVWEASLDRLIHEVSEGDGEIRLSKSQTAAD